jgi:hypothetical protein
MESLTELATDAKAQHGQPACPREAFAVDPTPEEHAELAAYLRRVIDC